MSERAPRPAARILLVDGQDRVLMFRFTPADRPPLWCTPGGAVDPGESYAAAARRELWEEVGLDIDCGPEVARRVVDFRTFEGLEVTADERYFRIDVDTCDVKAGNLTEQEKQLLVGHRWFPETRSRAFTKRSIPQTWSNSSTPRNLPRDNAHAR